jgi:dTDP-4-dehydrorhamnose reductase
LNILLTGLNGQVGQELQPLLTRQGSLVAMGRAALDLSDAGAIQRAVREVKPGLVVNAAAYTAVDRAEAEPELAMRVNGEAPGVLAEEARRTGALLVHYSTDYVFDGTKASPYREDDPTRPLGVYGRTKLEGEARVRASGCRHLIVRTAWVYGRGRNFMNAVLGQARKGAALRVVSDQFGAPTWAADIAATTLRMLELEGTYHVSAAGQASWFEVAREIFTLNGLNAELTPVTTEQYGARAPRPQYSVLDNAKLRAAGIAPIGDWRERLALYLQSQSG